MKLNIELFRFDKDSDYLPYYTKHFMQVKSEKTLQELLLTINKDQPFQFEQNDFIICINGVFTTTSITIEELVKNFGKELRLEPQSIRRAANDFLCDEKDFNSKMSILESYMDEEDKKTYNSYKLYFYASNTLTYEKAYIGDAILLLATDLIKKNPEDKKSILRAIEKSSKGANLHTSLEKRVYNFDKSIENRIKELQSSLLLFKEKGIQSYKSKVSKTINFKELTSNPAIKYDFKDFKLAYYNKSCEKTISLVKNLKAKDLFDNTILIDLALETFHNNEDLTYKIAADILIDAFDKSADFLLVDSKELFDLFDSNRKIFEKLSGRDVILPVIHSSELEQLSCGMHNEVRNNLQLHQINPDIV